MMLRTTLTTLLITLTFLAGCAANTPVATRQAGLSAVEEARLAELQARLAVANASPDSVQSRTALEEALEETRTLRDKRQGQTSSVAKDAPERKGGADATIVIIGVAVVVAAVVLISTWEFDFDLGDSERDD